MNQEQFDKIFIKLFIGLSELTAIIVTAILTAVSGFLIFFARRYIYSLLNKIGVTYFSERLKAIRDINSDLIWCMGALHANVYGLFRTYNGKAFVQDTPYSTNDSDIKRFNASMKKIIVKKYNAKPEEFFDDYLDKSMYESILKKSVKNDWHIFSYEELKTDNRNNPMLLFMESNCIEYLMTFRIWDMNNKTYGLIFFAWSNKPNIDVLFTRVVSKRLDSVSIRFQNYISSSIFEKIGIRRYT